MYTNVLYEQAIDELEKALQLHYELTGEDLSPEYIQDYINHFGANSMDIAIFWYGYKLGIEKALEVK